MAASMIALPTAILNVVVRHYVALFRADEDARIMPLLTASSQLHKLTVPHLYHTVHIKGYAQWAEFHQHTPGSHLQAVRHIIIGPETKRARGRDSVIARATTYREECDDSDGEVFDNWESRAQDIAVGPEGQRRTNLEHLETNGEWHWAMDPAIVDMWRPLHWTIRQRDIGQAFNREKAITAGTLAGVQSFTVDISSDYRHFRDHCGTDGAGPSWNAAQRILSRTLDPVAHDWFRNLPSGPKIVYTCEQRPWALPTERFDQLRVRFKKAPALKPLSGVGEEAVVLANVDTAFRNALTSFTIGEYYHKQWCKDPRCPKPQPLTHTIESLKAEWTERE